MKRFAHNNRVLVRTYTQLATINDYVVRNNICNPLPRSVRAYFLPNIVSVEYGRLTAKSIVMAEDIMDFEDFDWFNMPSWKSMCLGHWSTELAKDTSKSISNVTLSKVYAEKTMPQVKNIIFNPPATIVFWSDGTKTVVKCNKCFENFNQGFKCDLDGDECHIYKGDSERRKRWEEAGIAMAFAKKAFGKEYFKALEKYGQ